MKRQEQYRCWVVLDADGKPWDDEWTAHHASQSEAQDQLDEMRADAAEHMESSAAKEQARLDGLRVIQLDVPCTTVTCDYRTDQYTPCDARPESDQSDNLHFQPGEYHPDRYEWVTTPDGRDLCDTHRPAGSIA